MAGHNDFGAGLDFDGKYIEPEIKDPKQNKNGYCLKHCPAMCGRMYQTEYSGVKNMAKSKRWICATCLQKTRRKQKPDSCQLGLTL